jgi:hypothetical protein
MVTPSLPKKHPAFTIPLEHIAALKVVVVEGVSASFSPGGSWFLTRSGDETCLWDTRTLELQHRIEVVTRPGAFSPDDQHLVVYQSSTSQIQVLEVMTGQVVNRFAARSLLTGDEPIGASGISVPVLHFGPTGPELFIQVRPTYRFSEADDRYERMRQDATVYLVIREAFGDRILSHSRGEFGAVSFDGRYHIIMSAGATRMFDRAALRTVYRTREHVKEVLFSRDSQFFLIITGKRSQVLKLPEGEVVNQVDTTRWPNDHRGYSLPHTVWVFDRDNNVLIDGVTGEIIHRLDDLASPAFRRLSISPDGRYAAGIDHLRTLRVRDLSSGDVATHRDERFGTYNQLAFGPDGDVLLVMVESLSRCA